ncbi:MAG TPA: cob(I)yrinic acid a,c-diamide adenosyltransferase [Bacteroidales bacterium]|nr:cob(I)yrinic acid a,c-diamide adenosyltransferase [Bacteroidales bacterium]
MKVYTKTGDKGETSLVGGKRVAKSDLRLDAYGTADELLAFISLLKDQQISNIHKTILSEVQDHLMTCSAILAYDFENKSVKLPSITEKEILFLEKEIDKIEETLEPLFTFIIPGGHPIVSIGHVARTVCRRAERIVVKLAEEAEVPENVIKYLNRLSDYLFVLTRRLSSDLNIRESAWKPNLEL